MGFLFEFVFLLLFYFFFFKAYMASFSLVETGWWWPTACPYENGADHPGKLGAMREVAVFGEMVFSACIWQKHLVLWGKGSGFLDYSS